MKKLILLLIICLYLLMANTALAVDPKFRRPLNNSFSPMVTYYYDNQTGSGVKSYWCSTSTSNNYNGHQGTDFKSPFGTNVYAGANGGLYYRWDSCLNYGSIGNTCGGGYGNHVKIDHEGNWNDGIGWVTVYAHMKQGTIPWPMTVWCGSNIGQSASSGSSSAPHLHFEVKKYSYPGNDPFSGSCSHPTSFWVNQNGGTPTTQCQ